MLTNIEKKFSILFFIIVLIELMASSVETLNYLNFISKPAIVISLIFLFVKTSKHLRKRVKIATFFALVFSLIGDILLMFANQSEHFFTVGLIAFLLAHLMYISVFLKDRNVGLKPIGLVVFLIIYAAALFYLSKDGLGAMLLPVIIYMLVILSMAVTAYLRKRQVKRLSFVLVFAGAIFFMISDSILALDRFYQPLTLSNILIMTTYALAQYLIVIGILKNEAWLRKITS